MMAKNGDDRQSGMSGGAGFNSSAGVSAINTKSNGCEVGALGGNESAASEADNTIGNRLNDKKNDKENKKNAKNNADLDKTVYTTTADDTIKLNIDDLPVIFRIREFISNQIHKMSIKLNDPTRAAMLPREEVLDFFADVHSRYIQGADIAPELYFAFIKESNRLDAYYDSLLVEAKRYKGIFDNSNNDYREAVRRMRSAYESLNETPLFYELDAAITSYEPEISAMSIGGVCRDYWEGGAND